MWNLFLIARAEAWLGTWRHVDSRTSTVVQVRGVSTTEERGGREDDGVGLPRRALLAVAVPRGVLCNKTADYEPKYKIVFVIPQQIYATRDSMSLYQTAAAAAGGMSRMQ